MKLEFLGVACCSSTDGNTVVTLYSSYPAVRSPSRTEGHHRLPTYLVYLQFGLPPVIWVQAMFMIRLSRRLGRTGQSSSTFAFQLHHDGRNGLLAEEVQNDPASDDIEIRKEGMWFV